jgi:hypothetical protein
MCAFLRNLTGAIALMYLPTSGIAATITITCNPFCDSTSGGGASAGYYTSTPVDVVVSARATGGSYIFYPDYAGSSVRYEATLQIIFTGGSGGGVYSPNLVAGAFKQRTASGESAVKFGPAACRALDFFRSCSTAVIPFVFGEPQTQTLILSASASAHGVYPREGHGDGEAHIEGFQVFDAEGNRLSATWSVTDITNDAVIPEPVQYLPLSLGLVILWIWRDSAMRRCDRPMRLRRRPL